MVGVAQRLEYPAVNRGTWFRLPPSTPITFSEKINIQ